MVFWETLAPQDREMIVALPYRVGLWMSESDDTGGAQADEKEKDVLRAILADRGRSAYGSDFVRTVMAEGNARAAEWPAWSAGLETVPDECARAVRLLNGGADEEDSHAYRRVLMAIALDIARAFREFDVDAPLAVRLWTRYRLFLEKIFRFLKRPEAEENADLLNISYEEDRALSTLSKALYEDVGPAAFAAPEDKTGDRRNDGRNT